MTTLKIGTAIATNATADLGYDTYQVTSTAGNTFTLTLPTATGQDGTELTVTRTDTTSGSFVVATTGGQTIDGQATASVQPQSSTGLFALGGAWFIRATNPPLLGGNTIFVDATYGNDTTGLLNRSDFPFLTLANALTVAVSGDLVYMRPGTYAIAAAGVTIPTGVVVRGQATTAVTLTTLGTTTTGTMITLGNSTEVANLTINMTTTTTGTTLTAVSFPGTTNANARCTGLNITVDNSGGVAGSTLNAVGIRVTGTTVTTNTSWINCFACNVTVLGAGGGTKRALLLDTGSGTFSVQDGQYLAVQVVAATGAGTYGGVETTAASSIVTLQGCSCQGSLIGTPGAATAFDISETAGTIQVASGVAFLGTNATAALNSANALPFTTLGGASGYTGTIAFLVAFPAITTARQVPLSSSWTSNPPATAIAANVNIRFGRPTVLRNFTVRYSVVPATTGTVTMNVFKNGSASTLGVVLANGSPTAPGPLSDTTHSVAFSTTDLFCVNVTTANNASATTTCMIAIDVY